jgi:hypothetical protein
MTKLSKGAKLSQIYTNHSIRATGATIFTKSMFNPSQIMALTTQIGSVSHCLSEN